MNQTYCWWEIWVKNVLMRWEREKTTKQFEMSHSERCKVEWHWVKWRENSAALKKNLPYCVIHNRRAVVPFPAGRCRCSLFQNKFTLKGKIVRNIKYFNWSVMNYFECQTSVQLLWMPQGDEFRNVVPQISYTKPKISYSVATGWSSFFFPSLLPQPSIH